MSEVVFVLCCVSKCSHYDYGKIRYGVQIIECLSVLNCVMLVSVNV